MVKFVLVNAFSLNMFPLRQAYDLVCIPINVIAARALVRNHSVRGEFECAIGHPDTARVVANLIGVSDFAEEWAQIASTRPNVEFDPENVSLIVAQYKGPRLESGATELPEGATLEFWQVYKNPYVNV